MKKEIFAFIAGLIVLSGCTGDKLPPGQGCAEKNLTENCCPQPDSTVKDLPKEDIAAVNVFVETSGSMKGYMPPGNPATGFQTIVPEILSSLNTNLNGRVKFYSIFNSSSPFDSMAVPAAIDKIQHGSFEWSGSTYLPAMFDSMLSQHSKKNEVNIFISDCIYSPEKKEKKQQELEFTYFRDILKPYAKDLSATAFCMHSDFREKATVNSPYYIIVEGLPRNLSVVREQLLASFSAYKQPFNEVGFGLKFNRFYYSALPYSDITANFIANACDSAQNNFLSIQDIDLGPGNDTAAFWVGLDLSSLPGYATSKAYFDSNISATIENGQVSIISISHGEPSIVVDADKKIAKRCTHFLRLNIKSLSDKASLLKLSLKYTRPGWVNDLNETVNEDNRLKTYKLDEMVSGFESAFNQNDSGYFFRDYPIALIKK